MEQIVVLFAIVCVAVCILYLTVTMTVTVKKLLKHNVEFDGVEERTMFCIWVGGNAMTPGRKRAYEKLISNVGCRVVLITDDTLVDWEVPEAPIHRCYKDLSATHKADYLRCYLMHHYGGGYSDIKAARNSWLPYFDTLVHHPEKLAMGYREVGPHAVADVPDASQHRKLRNNYEKLIGCCAFIFRRQSELTKKWMDLVHQVFG